MILKKLELKNYRNYKNACLNFNSGLNILIGNNAQGKTNILESIYVLSLSKSFLTNNDKNLIKIGADSAKIKGIFDIQNTTKQFSVLLNHLDKKVYINDKEVKKISDYVLNIKIISFGPSDLKIIKDSPSGRRKFLNIALSQFDCKYFNTLSKFNSILRNRNEYLKKIKKDNGKYDIAYIEVLNNKYVDLCIEIFIKRKTFVDNINNIIFKKYGEITGDYNLSLKYDSIFNNVENTEYKQFLLNKLSDNFDKEIYYGSSIYGVHRDDFSFYLNDINLSLYGSQGQQRVAILALKLAELDIFTKYLNDTPILLLDDLFSELDILKKNNILKKISPDIQTIITTTDLNKIDDDLISKSNIYVINDGEVDDKNGK